MAGDGEEITDRRVLRGLRNRDAVVNAVIALIDEGQLHPTAAQIAERADVAVRSIYHHFIDLDDVTRAVAELVFTNAAAQFTPVGGDGPFEDRLKAFVRQRAKLAEQVMSIYRASMLVAPESPPVAERITIASQFLRAEIVGTFATELATSPKWVLESVDALTSLDGWVRLRVNQRLSVAKASAVLVDAARELLLAGSR